MTPFRQLDALPAGFLDWPASALARELGAPTLIHLPGRREPALFVSVLMHGNEPTGWHAVQALLRDHAGRELPRALSLFIGNVEAAAQNRRFLPDQPDFNRVWPGTDLHDHPVARMLAEVTGIMRARSVFASVDIHNNTGLNPHYGCVNHPGAGYLQLATLFSRTVVYFLRPRGVQSMAFGEFTPAVTLECGRPDDAAGIAHAREYLESCLRLAEVPDSPVAAHDIDLFHTIATVKVPDGVGFGFGTHDQTLNLAADADRLNFRELPAGTELGRVAGGQGLPLDVRDEFGADVAAQLFALDECRLVTRRNLMPSMLTLDTRVVRQDCLCYLMERLPDAAGVARHGPAECPVPQ
ncbi:MAG: succinylglutamate desuccinylase/aspartoacylase family protein [Chromatiales bacterium]|nr:succinylglutamate desuccinylase/aspartoacylase family protein [Chromatiales bacterium]